MKKFLPYILILIVLVGLFSPVFKIQQLQAAADYQLLAPLPCPPEDPDCGGGEKTFINPEAGLGSYLNLMIRIFIGLCAVLAVVMIVVGGLEYMTSELVSSKEAGKERIRGALLGLLIALSAYALLFTINPDLLNSDIKLPDATVQVTLAEAISSDAGVPPGVTTGCAAGIVKTQISMFACKDIVNNVNTMLNVAKNAGINITGGGYRSVEQQKQLRIKNCKGDVTNASAPCNPETALPGQSNHNNGKAFDLKCDGTFIQTSDNKCFVWLKANASTYGLFNLPSEPWHWSTDGR